MQNRLFFAALVAATPILALSPAAFPASGDPACVRATAGAREAYRHAVRDDSPGGKVHIIHIGGRFIVVDPDLVRDRRQQLVTFDSSFTRPLAVVTD